MTQISQKEEQPIISDRDFENHREVAAIASEIASQKIENGSKLTLPLPVGRMATLYDVPALISQCGDTAKEHGFWDAHVDQALKLFGLDRETYEMVKALAGSQAPKDLDSVKCKDGSSVSEVQLKRYTLIAGLESEEILGDPTIFLALIGTEISEAIEGFRAGLWTEPGGVWEELADAQIRLFDFVARYGPKHSVDSAFFLKIIQAKMAVNEARPPRHGKNF